MPKVFLRDLTDGYHPAIGDAMAFLSDAAALRPGLRVAIKPNLTFPVYRPGVMTSIEAIEALLRHLRDHGCQVTICEADSGGYNRFSMDQVFLATGSVRTGRPLRRPPGQPVEPGFARNPGARRVARSKGAAAPAADR